MNNATNTVHGNCSFTLNYYAVPGVWRCKMYFNDSGSNSDSNFTNATLSTNLALVNDLSTINYGSVSPSSNSSNVADNVTNYGNVALDTKFESTNLTSSGSKDINASNQWYAFGAVANFTPVPNATGAFNTSYNLNVSYDGTTASSNKTQYFLIAIDSGQPSGTYSGVLTITAQQH